MGVGLKKIYERFMFQLTDDEKVKVVTNCDHLKDLRFSYQTPYASIKDLGQKLCAVTLLNSISATEVLNKLI